MSTNTTKRSRTALGEQALHLIRDTADALRELDRDALRRRVEEASVRPSPGTGNALQQSLGDIVAAPGHHFKGAHDATSIMPVHLIGSRITKR